MPQAFEVRWTTDMFTFLKKAWKEGLSVDRISIQMRAMFQNAYEKADGRFYYEGSLTRNALSGVVARERSRKEYQGQYAERPRAGGHGRGGRGQIKVPVKAQPRPDVAQGIKPRQRQRGETTNPYGAVMGEKFKKTYEQLPKPKMSKYGHAAAAPPEKRNPKLDVSAFGEATEIEPVSFMQLEARMCRWPIDRNGETFYCGQHTEKTYCAYHKGK